MAPYASLADVLGEAPQLKITEATKPSIVQAEAIVTSINGQVDSILAGLGFTIPVTGPKSIEVLKGIVIQGSLAQILKAMFYGVRNPNDVGANDAWREFQGRLKALKDPNNPLSLPDAALGQQGDKTRLDFSSDVIDNLSDSTENWRPTRSQVF